MMRRKEYKLLRRFRFADKPKECTPEFLPTIRESDWLSQHKYDGWRLNVYKSGSTILMPDGEAQPGMTLFSRVGRFFPAAAKMSAIIAEQLKQLPIPDETVIDIEFVGPRGDHKPRVYIFDCLAWDDEWLSEEPYIDRWQRCQELANGKDLHLAETRESDFLGHFNELKQDWIASGMGMHLCEGIVLKRKRGKMELNLRDNKKSRVQFKLKYREIKQEMY